MSLSGIVPLLPVPAWLSELAGTEVASAAAWATEDGVSVRAGTSTGLLLFEHVAGHGWCRVVGPRRQAVKRFSASEHAERFANRMRWVSGARNQYTPTSVEASLRELCEALAGLRDPSAASAIASRVAELPPDVALYLSLLSPGWVVAADARDVPHWLAPSVAGLSGDFDALQQLAERPPREGPLEIVVGMAFDLAGFHDAAQAAFEHGVESVLGAERADLCIELSKLCRAHGDAGAAVRWARAALLIREPSDALLVRACVELVQNGAFDDAHLVLEQRCAREPFDRDVALALAELLAWAGRTEQARAWLERAGGDDLRAIRGRGVVLALAGEWDAALEAFSRANELRSGDAETGAWLAEAHLRLGALDDAARWLARSRVRSQSAVHVALTTAIHGSGRQELTALAESLGSPLREDGDDATTRAAARELLTRFGGNRGELLTTCSHASHGLGLRTVPRPTLFATRDAAASVLRRIGTAPLKELEQELDRLAQRHPESPHPLCYWGELELWLGHYDRAIALFERALSRQRARWGYVGRAAAFVLRGDYEAAEAEIAECERWFAPVLGATTPVYLGEASRRRGDFPRARALLRSAVDAKPGRAGAWMNLALTELALGGEEEATRIFEMLQARLPRLLLDAWISLEEQPRWPIPQREMQPLFERALEMMRGNRSSHTITYFDSRGALRIAQSSERWQGPLARHAPFVAIDLRRRLALGLTTDPE